MIAAADVLCVVVSYNGRDALRTTVDALRRQVGAVLVVDNGSMPETIAVLDDLAALPDVSVVRLGVNRGIGHALNRGIEAARAEGRTWLLTMDQDSLIEPGFIAAYSAATVADPGAGCLSPEIVSESAKRAAAHDVEVAYAITSGNLVRVELFDALGGYDEGFFVDCVDFDFSLRLRSLGHRIVRVHGARMRHQLGDPVRIPGPLRPFYARHSPTRRYYMFRNFLFLAERHLLAYPGFILKLGVLQGVLAVLIAKYDSSPLASYGAVARGMRDYLTRRLGPEPARA